MVALKHLSDYMSIQPGIFYIYHRDYGDVIQNTLKQSKDKAVFLWEPYKLTCIQGQNGKVKKMTLMNRFRSMWNFEMSSKWFKEEFTKQKVLLYLI